MNTHFILSNKKNMTTQFKNQIDNQNIPNLSDVFTEPNWI